MKAKLLQLNRNWHKGDTFISLSFLDQILSAEFLSKVSKLLEVKIDINQVNLTPCLAIVSYKKCP